MHFSKTSHAFKIADTFGKFRKGCIFAGQSGNEPSASQLEANAYIQDDLCVHSFIIKTYTGEIYEAKKGLTGRCGVYPEMFLSEASKKLFSCFIFHLAQKKNFFFHIANFWAQERLRIGDSKNYKQAYCLVLDTLKRRKVASFYFLSPAFPE